MPTKKVSKKTVAKIESKPSKLSSSSVKPVLKKPMFMGLLALVLVMLGASTFNLVRGASWSGPTSPPPESDVSLVLAGSTDINSVLNKGNTITDKKPAINLSNGTGEFVTGPNNVVMEKQDAAGDFKWQKNDATKTELMAVDNTGNLRVKNSATIPQLNGNVTINGGTLSAGTGGSIDADKVGGYTSSQILSAAGGSGGYQAITIQGWQSSIANANTMCATKMGGVGHVCSLNEVANIISVANGQSGSACTNNGFAYWLKLYTTSSNFPYYDWSNVGSCSAGYDHWWCCNW